MPEKHITRPSTIALRAGRVASFLAGVGSVMLKNMDKYEPIDANGKDLQIGDWVKVIAAPLSVSSMPEESREAFSKAVGETLQIEAFDKLGCLELDFYPKLRSFDTIWLEPFLCTRFRRYKKLSNAFQKRLILSRELDEKYST